MTLALAVQAVSRFLRVEPAEAEAVAARAIVARAQLKRSLRQQAGSRRLRMSGVLPARTEAPVVAALTFSRGSLLWLQRLSLVSARPLRILRTELSEPYFRDHARYHGPLELLTPIEMIRHRSQRGTGLVFITFPDHTVGNGNTNVQVPLFGENMLFQTLESLLARKHAAGLYRFDGECLERWISGPDPVDGGEQSLIAEATWLAAAIERTIAAAPADYFGWDRIGRKCPRRMQSMHRMRLEVLTGFLRSWVSQTHAGAEFLVEILALVERDGPGLVEAEANAGLRLARA